MIDNNIVSAEIDAMKLGDFSNATIRDIVNLANAIEKKTGEPFIHLEMGVPGLQPSQIGIEAEKKALDEGCASIYPPLAGIDRIRQAASKFIKAFIGIELMPQGCIATAGSMQGSYAVFTTLKLGCPEKDTILFINPGFPIQMTQCDIIGLKHIGLDIHDYRGNKLIAKLREILDTGNIAGIIYSNPNNPSWVCLCDEELRGIGQLATDYDCIILEDLAYFAMDFRKELSHPYEPPYQVSIAHYTQNYVILISASKAFSYAGQRIGICCISDGLYNREYPALREKFGVGEFGRFIDARVIYTLSSGCSQSTQHGMAAMMEAACEGSYDFVEDVREYGRRAAYMKKVLIENGFYLVYDNDMGEPLADGFYFTVQYPGMTDLQLTKELMYYGISVFPLETMGSLQQGVRICTSFFKPEHESLFKERIVQFHKDHTRQEQIVHCK